MKLIKDIEVRLYFECIPCIAYVNVYGDEIDDVTLLVPCDEEWNETSSNLLPRLNEAAQYVLDDLIIKQLSLMKKDSI
jgi:hypothetical protein